MYCTIFSVVLFLVGADLVQCLEKSPNCTTNNSTCDCYNYLVYNVLKSDENQYNLTRAFFPPEDQNPVSVVVYYDFRNETGDIDPSLQQVWFWTTSTFYLFQPQEILQYTSLFFTDPSSLTRSLNLTLDMKCADAIANNEDYARLLTQRLKLYTMQFSINPKIPDDYNPKAENASTIYEWNNKHKKISRYLMSWKVIAPLFVLIAMSVGISYFLFAKPHAHHDKVKESIGDKSERGWVIRTNMYIVMALSIVFSIYVVGMDITAIVNKKNIQKEFREWYRKHGRSSPLDELYNLVTAILVVDLVALIVPLLYVLVLLITGCILCFCCKKQNENKGECYCCVPAVPWFTAVPWYFVITPAVHIAAHSNQVLIGFIHTPYHATAIGILYGIIFVTCVALLKFISKLVHACVRVASTDYCKSKCKCCNCCIDDDCWKTHQIECVYLILTFLVVLIVIVLIFAYFITIYFLLPINKAVDDAPNRILAIYQGIIVVFAAFLTYWVVRGQKSPLSYLIEAKDKVANQKHDANWKKCTYRQKEVIISEDLLSHLQVRKNEYESLDPATPTVPAGNNNESQDAASLKAPLLLTGNEAKDYKSLDAAVPTRD